MNADRYALRLTGRRYRLYPQWMPFGEITTICIPPPDATWEHVYGMARTCADGGMTVTLYPNVVCDCGHLHKTSTDGGLDDLGCMDKCGCRTLTVTAAAT